MGGGGGNKGDLVDNFHPALFNSSNLDLNPYNQLNQYFNSQSMFIWYRRLHM